MTKQTGDANLENRHRAPPLGITCEVHFVKRSFNQELWDDKAERKQEGKAPPHKPFSKENDCCSRAYTLMKDYLVTAHTTPISHNDFYSQISPFQSVLRAVTLKFIDCQKTAALE